MGLKGLSDVLKFTIDSKERVSLNTITVKTLLLNVK
jgi:hypothetical protein